MAFFLLTSCRQPRDDRPVIRPLDSGWTLSQGLAPDQKQYPAQVPGNVHLDLLAAGVIEDPFYRDNETRTAWIGNEDWTYETTFNLNQAFLGKDRLELVFEGLDTHADVFINGKKILTADNMFRRWVIDIGEYALPGENRLVVAFQSPVSFNTAKAGNAGIQLPDDRAYSRKAPYQFGWDWGPGLVTCGIWKPVYLEAWNGVRIQSVQVLTVEITADEARGHVRLDIEAARDARVNARVTIAEGPEMELSASLAEGSNMITLPFTISAPRLWWTRELGDQHMYNLKARISAYGVIVDEKTEKFGLRTIELVQEPDSAGMSFYFKLNGHPVFMKGANYIPQDNFPSRVPDINYHRLISNCRKANMNMLRVWGGGFYEKDLFYDLCDEQGILVWQDFMFAGTMYPGDSAFASTVRQEAIDNITRLRNHPCIALWCGNNEVDEGWHNWGWQEQFRYSVQDAEKLWHDYQLIFHQVLPGVVTEYDGTRPYWPSSPSIGWGHPESLKEGDSHYWGVWWGGQPFDTYARKVGRFMSEYGFQGFPDNKTMEAFSLPEDRYLGSPVILAHQKHPRGMELIQQYMERDYRVPGAFDDYAYVSQVNQAEGISMAIEAHRRAKPYCMGTLYWQLNDCWPVISWSGLDYYQRWKPLHYHVRHAYEEILVSPYIQDGTLKVAIISDRLVSSAGVLEATLLSFSGDTLGHYEACISLPPNSSKIYLEIDTSGFLSGLNLRNTLFTVRFMEDDGKQSANCLYFLPVKDIYLEDAAPKARIAPVQDGWEITLTNNYLVKNLWLSSPGDDGHFSENGFDLMPGEEKMVIFIPNDPTYDLRGNLRLISLNGIVNREN